VLPKLPRGRARKRIRQGIAVKQINMNDASNSSCDHPIHELLTHLPNFHEAKCRKVVFYKGNTGKTRNPIRMCCSCYRLRQPQIRPNLIVCHWLTFGDMTLAKCEYCQSPLETTRPIFQCQDCIYSYFERALFEKNQGRNINNLNAFAFCRTHRQGIYT